MAATFQKDFLQSRVLSKEIEPLQPSGTVLTPGSSQVDPSLTRCAAGRLCSAGAGLRRTPELGRGGAAVPGQAAHAAPPARLG